MRQADALIQSLAFLLGHVRRNGSWHDQQVDDWDGIITCFTCELLLSCGMMPDAEWVIDDPAGPWNAKLSNSLHWLNEQIQPAGSFGTDYWDAARLGTLIETFHLHDHFPRYGSLRRFLVEKCRDQKVLDDGSQWTGPGFLAAGATYLSTLNQKDVQEKLLTELVRMQQADGSWKGATGPDGIPIVPIVWHTAQSVIVLARTGAIRFEREIQGGVKWLRNTQDKKGHWPSVQQYQIYTTAYAVIALLVSGVESRDSIERATSFLLNQSTPDGKCADLGGTLMCALALRENVGDHVEYQLALTDYVAARRATDVISGLRKQLADVTRDTQELKAKNSEYERRYSGAEIVLTKAHLFLISLIGLGITFLGTIAGVFALKSFLK